MIRHQQNVVLFQFSADKVCEVIKMLGEFFPVVVRNDHFFILECSNVNFWLQIRAGASECRGHKFCLFIVDDVRSGEKRHDANLLVSGSGMRAFWI